MVALTTALAQALAQEHLPHANLLVGYESLADMAMSLAAAYNCEGATPPCGACRPCVKTRDKLHPDVQWLDCGAANVPVEQIRKLCAELPVLPNEGQRKIYILLQADNLSHICQNALLQALEEPPRRVVFILTAARPDLLLPTVRSRLSRWQCDTESATAADMPQLTTLLTALRKRDELLILQAALACDKLDRVQMNELLSALRQALLATAATMTESAPLLTAVTELGVLQEGLRRNAGIGHVCGAIAVTLSQTFMPHR